MTNRFEITDSEGNWINTVVAVDIAALFDSIQGDWSITDLGESPNYTKKLKDGYYQILDEELARREALPFAYTLTSTLTVVIGAERNDRADLSDAITTTERVLTSLDPLATIPVNAENGEFDLAIDEARMLSILMLQRLSILREKYREMKAQWPTPLDPYDDNNWS